MNRKGVAAVLVAVLTACGGGGPSPSVSAGDPCSEGDQGTVRCGKSLTGLNAVVECSEIMGSTVWIMVEECAVSCVDGACSDQVLPDVTTDQVVIPPKDGNEQVDVQTGVDKVTPPEETTGGDTTDPNSCDPGQIDCEDDYTVKSCNWFGNGWDLEPCPEGQGCDLGYCMDVICTPGTEEGKCLGPTAYSVCSANGVKWEPSYCAAPMTCYEGKCVSYQCPPGQKICKGMTAIQECQAGPDGNFGWVVTEECKSGICKDGVCMSACEVNLKENTYLGCDYFAVDLDNVEVGEFQPVAVVVSVPTAETSPATITFTDMAAVPPKDLTPADLQVSDMVVQPGELKIFILPPGHDINGSILTTKTFRVSSTAPVTVHQFNPLNGEQVYTNDASLLLPSNVGGTEYFALSWPMRTDGFTFRGLVAIIATQDGTTEVKLWPTSPVLGGPNVPSMAPNPPDPYVFYMNKGDVLNIETDGSQGADLTGTWIKSDQKVNVIGGHECANVPLGVNYCDHIEQQLIPINTWGSEYVADAFRTRDSAGAQKDTWRIIGGAANVMVVLDPPVGGGTYNLVKGQWVELQTGSSFHIKATGPILVGHYMQGSNYSGFEAVCGFGATGIGDPALTIVAPVKQFLKEYIVLTPPSYQQDFINITFKVGTEGQITIDGNPMVQFTAPPYSPVPAGSSGYAVAQIPVADGVHTIKTSGEDGFGVTAYGYDCDVSYAYPGGLKLESLQ